MVSNYGYSIVYEVFVDSALNLRRAMSIAFAHRNHLGRSAALPSSRPLRLARSIRFLTEEGAHLVPPRGVRSCKRSSWLAISRNVNSGLDEWIPATSVMRRSSGGRGGDFRRSALSAIPSETIHLTARRSRSGVQSKPRFFKTLAISSQVWSGRMRRTVGSQSFAVDWIRAP